MEEMLAVVVDTHLSVEKLMHYAHKSIWDYFLKDENSRSMCVYIKYTHTCKRINLFMYNYDWNMK